MEIKNGSWLPFINDYKILARVKKVIVVYIEDTDVAGMYDDDIIVVNVAPNVLAEISGRYGLKPHQLERTALSVFMEECVHSQGVDDEEKAVVVATVLSSAIPDKYLMENSGIARYTNRLLHGEVEPIAI